jgi:hypothetical protein
MAFAETLDEARSACSRQHAADISGRVTELGKPMAAHTAVQLRRHVHDRRRRGHGVVPESAARRNRESMGLALIELTDAWSVRERRILVRDQGRLPRHAQALIEVLQAYYAVPAVP